MGPAPDRESRLRDCRQSRFGNQVLGQMGSSIDRWILRQKRWPRSRQPQTDVLKVLPERGRLRRSAGGSALRLPALRCAANGRSSRPTAPPAVPRLRARESPRRPRNRTPLERRLRATAATRRRLRTLATRGPASPHGRGRASNPRPGRRPARALARRHHGCCRPSANRPAPARPGHRQRRRRQDQRTPGHRAALGRRLDTIPRDPPHRQPLRPATRLSEVGRTTPQLGRGSAHRRGHCRTAQRRRFPAATRVGPRFTPVFSAITSAASAMVAGGCSLKCASKVAACGVRLLARPR